MNSRIEQVTSRDGTSIAFERNGEGPPVVLVMGAFNDRSTGAPLAAALSPRLTVYTYDRRGRGDSGDTMPYAVEREVEDLDALIAEAGGSAAVFGYSSGAVLALNAASQGLPITKLILHELPLMVDRGQPRWSADHQALLRELVAAGRRGDAVEYFQSNLVGIPNEVVAQLRQAPFRPALEAMAHTLVYEAAILGDGLLLRESAGAITTPVLAISGEATTPFMIETAHALAEAAPAGRSVILEAQGHDIDPEAVAPVVEEFLGVPTQTTGRSNR
jgi:pimeloyl-ACP methyl ester carboxylesterase